MTNSNPTPTPVSWERIKGESDKAFAAFMDYAQMGAVRSLRDLHDRYLKRPASDKQAKPPTTKLNTLFTWSLRFHWQERVKGWDDNENRLRLIEHEAAVKEMSRKHVQQAQVLAQGLMMPALELLRRLKDNPKLLETLDLDDLTTLLVRGARTVPHVQKAERLAMGQPTQLLELWAMSDEQIVAKYKHLLTDVQDGSGLEAVDLIESDDLDDGDDPDIEFEDESDEYGD